MIRIKSQANFLIFGLLWAIAIMIGWSIYIFQGIKFETSLLSSWADLFSLVVVLLLNTFVLGAIVGVMQYLLLKPVASISAWWIGFMGLSYSLGSSLSLVFSSIFVWIFQPEIFSSQGQSALRFPLVFVMFIGGGLIGLIQIFPLRKTFIQTVSEGVVWALMSALGWVLGFFIMLAFSNSPRVQSSIAGLVIGIVTGLALFILSKNRLRQPQTTS